MNYDWTRYWRPKDSTAYLSDDGYLYDPADSMGKYYNTALMELSKLNLIGCLILLGNAGSGKTTELHKERQRLLAENSNIAKQILWFDLGEFLDEQRLCNEIFNHEFMQQWINSDYPMYLFLDSFDECLLRFETLPGILLNKLAMLPLERLYLRIGCRSNMWPSSWEHEIKNLWPTTNGEIYVLTPLRRSDVEQAISDRALKGPNFLEEVRRLGVENLARKPTTLALLFQLYDEKRGLSQSATDLYYQCCVKVCTELNPKRYGRKIDGRLTGEERLAIASRIAAITIFGDKTLIAKGTTLNRLSSQCTHFEELCGGIEYTNLDQVRVGRDELKETLEMTGLFDLEIDNTLGWSDKNIVNFLAALYLKRRGVTLDEINNLTMHLGHPGLTLKKIIPQFEKTVEWLVSLMPELFSELLTVNPILLVSSDLSKVKEEYLEKLVKETLEYYKRPGIPPSFRLDVFQHYHKLRHSTLSKQLREYITNSEELEKVRYEALLVASECQVEEVQNEVLFIAMDSNESIHIRSVAIKALKNLANNEVKSKLKELLTRDDHLDVEDELKGYILRCLWPNMISAKEIFSKLTPRKRTDWMGSYHMFLRYELAQYLKKEDLPYVLNWLAISKDETVTDNIEEKTIRMTIENIWDEQIFQSFVNLIIVRIKKHRPIVPSSVEVEFSDLMKKNQELHCNILKAVLTREKTDWSDLVYSKPAIMQEDDISWLLTEISREEDIEKQQYLARLVSWLVDSRKSDRVVEIYYALKDRTHLQGNFQWLFGIIELGSQQAEEMKEYFDQHQKWEEDAEKKIPVIEDSFTQEELIPIIEKINKGELLSWKEIDGILSGNAQRDYTCESDVTDFPRWQKINNVMRTEIIKIALTYVEHWVANVDQWWNKDSFSANVFSDYRALRLALESDTDRMEGYPAGIWEKWTAFVLSYPAFGENNKKREHKKKIVERFYNKVPDKVIEALMGIIDYENAKGNIFILDEMKYCWDQNLQEAIMRKVEDDKNLLPGCMATLLDALLQRKFEAAFSYAQKMFELPGSSEQRIIVADTVLRNGGLAQWQSVWTVIEKDNDFAKALMLKVASNLTYYKYEFMNYITIDAFAELYILLCELFPYDDDQNFAGAHAIGPREEVARFRDGILNRIKSTGTWAACNAIERIKQQLQYEWLEYSMYEATRQALINTKRTFQTLDILGWGAKKICYKRGKLMEGKSIKGRDEVLVIEGVDNEVSESIMVLPPFKILHISDLHINESTDPLEILQPMLTDLKSKRGVFFFDKMDCVVISGDITSGGKKEEFDKAQEFVEMLLDEIGVHRNKCIIVPGNHDMDRDINVYDYKEQIDKSSITKDRYIQEGSGYLVRNEGNYFGRFKNFADFYKNITKRDYPINHQTEGVIYSIDEVGIQILGFNSCWEIDKKNPKRTSINSSAVAKCLMEVREMDSRNERENKAPIRLRLAVIHHPVNGQEKISNEAILERFSSVEVRLLLHGHVHEERDEVRNHHNKGKRLVVAGTGTLGAKSPERPPSAPYLYSVIEIHQDKKIKVYVRSKLTDHGTWEGLPRWQGTTPSDSTFFYEEDLAY